MLSPAEMEIQVAMTRAFLESDIEQVSVYRPTRVHANGGYTDTLPYTPSHTEVCRMIQQTNDTSSQADEVRTPEGERRNPRYVLMALPTANLRQGDIVLWHTIKWRLKQQHIVTPYELKFDMVKYVGR